jgi:hypothetical protein
VVRLGIQLSQLAEVTTNSLFFVVVMLHNFDPKVTFFLNTITTLELVVIVIWGGLIGLTMEFVGACLVKNPPWHTFYF